MTYRERSFPPSRFVASVVFSLQIALLVACSAPAADIGNDIADETVTPVLETPALSVGNDEGIEAPSPDREVQPVCAVLPASIDEEDIEFSWWNDAVFYEVFVRSFYDSDADGVGDLNGLIQKLDYLNDGDPSTTDDLGVTGIWLMPVMESPSNHGYDVIDYYTIDEEYGTNEEFLRLMEEAHRRGIRVVVDLVLNHTSIQHPWFQEASSSNESPYREYYVWESNAQDYRSPWGTQVWYPGGDSYYYAVFWEGMPDLNYRYPPVSDEMYEVTRFWLEEMGVDGFRLDAIKHLIEDGKIQENTAETHEWLEAFHTTYKSINPDAFTVGEAWTSTQEVVNYTGDEVDVAFEFDTAQAIIKSARYGLNRPILAAHTTVTDAYPPHQYATFITNHDQDRAMSQLGTDEGSAKVAASLLLTGPGVPFIYYGEEIGHTGRKPDPNLRSPMQWSGDKYAGFTSASLPWRRPQADYQERNVALQAVNPDSILNHYRRLVHLRNEHSSLRTGQWLALDAANGAVYSYLRYDRDETLLVLINLADEATAHYALCLPDQMSSVETATEILTGASVVVPSGGGQTDNEFYKPVPELEPQGTYVIELN